MKSTGTPDRTAVPDQNSFAEGAQAHRANDLRKRYGFGRIRKMCGGPAKAEFVPSALVSATGLSQLFLLEPMRIVAVTFRGLVGVSDGAIP